MHDALGRFAQRFPQQLPDDICAELVALAEAVLAELTGSPRVAAFWAPRFARFAAWFAETERARRAGVQQDRWPRSRAASCCAAPAGPFTLTARADRIDVGEGGLVITDYKTGGNVKDLAGRAEQGEAPQLPLEAAIAAAGGFAGLAARRGRGAALHLGAPAASRRARNARSRTATSPRSHARRATGLERLIAALRRRGHALSRAAARALHLRYDDYAHLARVAEWSAETDEEA